MASAEFLLEGRLNADRVPMTQLRPLAAALNPGDVREVDSRPSPRLSLGDGCAEETLGALRASK